MNPALAKILIRKSNSSFEISDTDCRLTNHNDRRIPIKGVISLLAKNGIIVNEAEALIILEFLYTVAKTYKIPGLKPETTLSGNRTIKKYQISPPQIAF